MSGFKPYPAYKDSGVEWLGEVPEEWETWKIAHAFGAMGSGTTPPTNENNWYENGVVPWITSSELREGVIFETKKLLSSSALSAFSALRLHPAGSLAIAMYGATIGRLGILGIDATTNQACCLLTQSNHLDVKFTFYWLLVFKQTIIDLYATGGGQPNINQDVIASLKVPAPDIECQTQIARFLDHETARIDALIEEQQRLIELLKEKRQAVISHAVTKGLDPTVPMKDSGVEWLGEVPAHWSVGALRWYATIQGGIAKGKDYEGRKTLTVPYLRVANVQNGFLDLTEVKEISVLESEVGRYSLRTGDVLMNEGGDNDKLGRGAVWQGQIEPCLHQNHVFAIRPNGFLNEEWLATFTQSEQARIYFFLNSKQSTNLASISASNVMSLTLPIPSVREQQEILAYLEEARAQYEQLVEVAASTVNLLQERRAALISAAVTGKIDVRNWQPETASDSMQESMRMAAEHAASYG